MEKPSEPPPEGIDLNQLQAWRTEIAGDIAEAEKELVEAETSLTEAREELRIASEKRQAACDAGASLKGPVAGSLASRLDTFRRSEHAATGKVSLATQVVSNVRYRISDLESGSKQIERLISGVSEPEPQTGIIRG